MARGASFDSPSEITKLRARVRVLEVELEGERRERWRVEERAAEIETEANVFLDVLLQFRTGAREADDAKDAQQDGDNDDNSFQG